MRSRISARCASNADDAHSICRQLDRRVTGGPQGLIAQNPAARKVSANAMAVLVFPNVVKAGFLVGAQGGEGILFVHGKPAGRYRTTAASYGLQAGVQKFGYALFFMNQKAVNWVNSARGWSIGSAPSLVVVDKGMARTMSTETLHSGIYAFTFDQKGLWGLGIRGPRLPSSTSTNELWENQKPTSPTLSRG